MGWVLGGFWFTLIGTKSDLLSSLALSNGQGLDNSLNSTSLIGWFPYFALMEVIGRLKTLMHPMNIMLTGGCLFEFSYLGPTVHQSSAFTLSSPWIGDNPNLSIFWTLFSVGSYQNNYTCCILIKLLKLRDRNRIIRMVWYVVFPSSIPNLSILIPSLVVMHPYGPHKSLKGKKQVCPL